MLNVAATSICGDQYPGHEEFVQVSKQVSTCLALHSFIDKLPGGPLQLLGNLHISHP